MSVVDEDDDIEVLSDRRMEILLKIERKKKLRSMNEYNGIEEINPIP